MRPQEYSFADNQDKYLQSARDKISPSQIQELRNQLVISPQEMRAFHDKKEGHVHVPEVEGAKLSPEQLSYI